MTWELYAAYLAATIIVLTIPGPTVMLVVSYALSEGRRSAWGTVAGVAAGDLRARPCRSPAWGRCCPPPPICSPR